MWEFLADKVLSGAVDWALGLPWYIWAIPAAVVIGLAVKLYKIAGWQGILGAIALIVTVGAYRQGWNDASRRRGPNSFDKPVEEVGAKPRVRTIQDMFRKRQKRRYNRLLNVWETPDAGN